jgi:hypothetical protein
MTRYLEITIDFTGRGDGSFEVKARGTGGQAGLRFTPPFTLAEVGPMLAKSVAQRGTVGSDDDERQGSGGIAEIGELLYGSLFRDGISRVLSQTEGLVASGSDNGIRIRMNFDLRESGIATVAALPWELMRRPGELGPLLASTQTVLVRSLDMPAPAMLRPIKGPLRVLLIKANPKGTATLDLRRESEMVGRALADLPGVVVEEVEPVEDRIFSRCIHNEYHVVHYMGHGDFAAAEGGMLLLEDEAGNAVPTSADAFAHLFRDEPLRLVFLNACETGVTPRLSTLHPFAGVAAALVSNGVPAVVAMQFPISDRAALRFSKIFYESLTAGQPVDVAVAQGRRALYLNAARGRHDDIGIGEWATPVLYLRDGEGALLPIVPAQPAASPAAPVPTVAPAPIPAAAPMPPPAPESMPAPTSKSAPAPSSPVTAPSAFFKPGGVPRRIAMAAAAAVVLVVAALLFAGWSEERAREEFFGRYRATAEQAIGEIRASAWIDDGIVEVEMRPWQAGGRAGEVAGLFDLMVKDFQPENDTSARKETLRRLADGGNPKAAYLLVVQTLTESPDDGDTAAEATRYLLQAASGDVPAAMAALAERLALGQGTAEDRAAASSWLRKAREKCNTWVLPASIGLPDEPLGAACKEVRVGDLIDSPAAQAAAEAAAELARGAVTPTP